MILFFHSPDELLRLKSEIHPNDEIGKPGFVRIDPRFHIEFHVSCVKGGYVNHQALESVHSFRYGALVAKNSDQPGVEHVIRFGKKQRVAGFIVLTGYESPEEIQIPEKEVGIQADAVEGNFIGGTFTVVVAGKSRGCSQGGMFVTVSGGTAPLTEVTESGYRYGFFCPVIGSPAVQVAAGRTVESHSS